MKIVVCIKHVPDVQSERRIEDARLVRGEDDVLNELDENAVEAAVSLVEELDGEVVALTMGPEDAEDAIRRALQMGADSGVVVSDDELVGADVVATARVLAAAIERIGDVDLVVTGMASLDALTSMLPGALAAALGMPALTLASSLEASAEGVTITRTTGTLSEVLSAPLPALVSVTDQANEPRYPNFAAMRAAKKKPVDTWDLEDLGLEPRRRGAAARQDRRGQGGSRMATENPGRREEGKGGAHGNPAGHHLETRPRTPEDQLRGRESKLARNNAIGGGPRRKPGDIHKRRNEKS